MSLNAAVTAMPRAGKVTPVKPYAQLHDPKPPAFKPEEILQRIKVDIFKGRQFPDQIGRPQRDGLVLTATDGYRAVLEAETPSKPSGVQLCPLAGAEAVLAPSCALALKRVGCLSPERSHHVLWTWEGPKLTLSASSPDYGEASEWFPVNDPGDGITRVSCLNWQYILPIFGRVPVVMTWSSRQSKIDPLVFHPEGASWRYVVMPMRF